MMGGVVAAAHSAEIVRRELRRIIESAAFRQSKRCCSLLTYVVEAALEERWDYLRERSIGVELFHRPSNYGTAEDAVVRVAAGDVRKRLAQYYDLAGTEEGLRIELPSGGYQPVFRWAETEAVALPAIVPLLPLEAAPANRPEKALFPRLFYFLIPALILLAVFGAHFLSGSSFERFWQPALSGKDPILVNLGVVQGLSSPVPLLAFDDKRKEACATLQGCESFVSRIRPIAVDSVPTGDAVGVAQIMALLGRKGRAFRVRGSTNTTYSDLNESDSILIGYFSNRWTVATFEHTRFRLVHTGGHHVLDTQHPESREWSIPSGWPAMQNELDYAIAARIQDEKTGKVRLVAGGFTPFGTEAAAQFLASEKQMTPALSKLGRGWESRNIEWVLRTHVQAMLPGPAEVIASQVW